jgi:hypothetical protein
MLYPTPERCAALLVALLLTLGLSACGPVESLVVLNQANLNFEAAQRSEAGRYSPYEYVSARERIHKAREEMNYSDFEVAIDLALEARKMAAQAREKALTHPERTTLPPAGGIQDPTDRLD